MTFSSLYFLLVAKLSPEGRPPGSKTALWTSTQMEFICRHNERACDKKEHENCCSLGTQFIREGLCLNWRIALSLSLILL